MRGWSVGFAHDLAHEQSWNARSGGPNALPGKIIAQLSWDFWRYLTSAVHEITLWRPAPAPCLSTGTARAQGDARIGRLHSLRNRVAHHEPLLALDAVSLHHDLY